MFQKLLDQGFTVTCKKTGDLYTATANEPTNNATITGQGSTVADAINALTASIANGGFGDGDSPPP